ncbi:MAG: acyltransferase family protein [Coriobacteriaceae bacterium]|nr:acyltransferase family protein [Coriobacteriaceae bacterium]
MTNSAHREAPAQAGVLRFRYNPALDGIRTLAVAAVVLYHLNPMLAPGGMQGVTIFFVLSGFLITRLLLVEMHNTGRIDFKSFWQRRLRRLVPAVVTVITVTAALCTLLNHVMLTKMRPDIIPSALFFNNWWQIFNQQSYFNAIGDPSPLTHFWSLAIEMQFYLIWPLVLMMGLRWGRSHRGVRRFALVLAVVSVLEMALLYNPAADPSRVYYGTDTRAFSLLLGAWLAFLPLGRINLALTSALHRVLGIQDAASQAVEHAAAQDESQHAESTAEPQTGVAAALARITAFDLIGLVGLAGTLLLMAFTNGYSAFPYRGGIALASIFAMMLIMGCTHRRGPIARLFGLKPLVWLGQRSYSIYLWHYPLLLLMNPASDVSAKPWWVLALQVFLVIGVSELCFRFVETPFRHGAFGRIFARLRERKAAVPSWCKRHAWELAGPVAVLAIAVGGLLFVPPTSALSETGANLLQGGGASQNGNTPGSTNENGNKAHASGTPDNSAKPGTASKPGKQSKPGGSSTHATADFPEGSYDLTMIGDSVSLRAVNAFPNAFPHSHIDAAVNRQFNAGIEIYQSLLDQNLAGPIAVFALGTNGPVAKESIDQLVELAGKTRIVVFVNNRCARPWCEPNNQLFADAAKRHKNVRVVDWFGASANRNELFDGDGIHLSDAGVAEYLKLIKDKVAAYLPVYTEDGTDPRIAAAQQITDAVKNAIAAKAAPGSVKSK